MGQVLAKFSRSSRRILLYGLVGFCLSLGISLSLNLLPALGQIPFLPNPTGVPPLPTNVERRGTLEATGIRLDGRELFRIASPAVFNRAEPGVQIPVEIRAKQIEANLEQLVLGDELSETTMLDPKTLEVSVERLNGQPVLFARDEELAEARVLLTVTNPDAQYYGIGQDQLASRWRQILEDSLREALKLRQPEALRQQIAQVVKVAIAVLLLMPLLIGIWTFWGRRSQRLQQQLAAELAAVPAEAESEDSPPAPLSLWHELRDYLGLQRRLHLARFLRWLTFWVIGLVWMTGLAYGLNSFPQTRQFARQVIVIPIVVLIAWFVTGLINRLTDLGIDRYIESRERDKSLTAANCQRISTIARVLKGLKMVLVYAISMLWVVQWLQIAPGSVLALGALVALAASFAAQSLVKDLVNGFLILLEDHFRIGDRIRTETATGFVENLNLRITQIRNDDGNLITLPNSRITQVENMSRTWARTDFRIEVAYNTDVDYALAVVRATVDEMAVDPAWRSMILDTQELFGVDQISHSGITIRIWIKTAPLKQWVTARELRRRLKIAFDQHNIQIGIPQQLLHGAASDILNKTGDQQKPD